MPNPKRSCQNTTYRWCGKRSLFCLSATPSHRGRAGKSVVWLQHALGHASPDTTLRRYSHWVKQEQEDMSFLKLVEKAR